MNLTTSACLWLRRVAIAATLFLAGISHAFPDRPIKLVVPYPAGGTADALARAIAEHMKTELGQAVLVDNKPGANTIIGAQAVIASPADGHTVLLSTAATLVLNPLMYSKLPYSPERDLAPVGLLASSGLVMVVSATSKAASVTEFIARSKSDDARVNYASIGSGSSMHLASELFKLETTAEMSHVPYNGSAPALTALLGGTVDVFFDAVGTSLPHIRSGRLKPLAVTTLSRLAALPEVPTMAEAGVKGYEASVWFGLSVPARTPAAIVQKLSSAINSALNNPKFRSLFEGQGFIIASAGSPEDYSAHVKREQAKWSRVISARKITLD